MTRLMSSMARTPAPALLATATLAAMSTNFQRANADPKAIDAGKPPRDLADTHKVLCLDDHPGAVCVLVPELSMDAAAKNAALKLLTGSTMNGRYVDEAAAKKLLADMMAGSEDAAVKKFSSGKHGTGKGTFKRFGIKKVGLGHGVTISHHRELGNTIGLKRRGMHLALDD
ncbi:MAG: hypothetical protein E6Q53_01035 [Candidatus Moraniibacteriota bacterium]|nr:MAG: hypothetical protein E6Q53_01035 [Candidatus Moranbacteria bacterium]